MYDPLWLESSPEQTACSKQVFVATGRVGSRAASLVEFMMNFQNTNWYARVYKTAKEEPPQEQGDSGKLVQMACQGIVSIIENASADGAYWKLPEGEDGQRLAVTIASFVVSLEGNQSNVAFRNDPMYENEFGHVFLDLILGMGWEQKFMRMQTKKPAKKKGNKHG